jgi:hypothetical protein
MSKQIPNPNFSNSKQNRFGHWHLGIGAYLDIGIWCLEFVYQNPGVLINFPLLSTISPRALPSFVTIS